MKVELHPSNFVNVYVNGDFEDRLRSIENLIGGSADDELTGSSDNNRLDGGGGNDVLIGGLGDDRLFGGKDDDKYYVSEARDAVSELNALGQDMGGRDTVFADITFSLASSPRVLGKIENLTLIGTGKIDGFGNSAKE